MKARARLTPRFGDAQCTVPDCRALVVSPWAFAGRGDIRVWQWTDQPGASDEARIPWKERGPVVRQKAS